MSTLGDRIRDYALGRTGQQVGRGECTDLATFALREVGARASFPAHGGHAVWGTAVAAAAAEPGDVLQFRNHRTTIANAGGDVTTEQRGHPQHTAVVVENLGNGVLRVAEQNIVLPGARQATRTVMTNTVFLTGRVLPDQRTVTVGGQVWAYRPEPAASPGARATPAQRP
jgi:hypothetical protein